MRQLGHLRTSDLIEMQNLNYIFKFLLYIYNKGGHLKSNLTWSAQRLMSGFKTYREWI